MIFKITVFIYLQLGSVWILIQNGTFDLGSGWTAALPFRRIYDLS